MTRTLLTERQVKDFIVDGFLVLTPEELPGGREQFASKFYDKVRSIAGPEVVGGEYRSRDETLWEAVTPDVNTVLAASTVRGALTSLLGPDFVGPPGNSLMHISQPSDQMYALLEPFSVCELLMKPQCATALLSIRTLHTLRR